MGGPGKTAKDTGAWAGAAGEVGGTGDNVGPVVGAGPGVCPERQPVGLNLQGHGRREGKGDEGDKGGTEGVEDETRMSSLDAWKIKGCFVKI